MRKVKFQNEYYYHIYNRGVDKREVFDGDKDYLRFLRSMREFNRLNTIESIYRNDQIKRKESKSLRLPCNRRDLESALVDIICFNLLPNHYHLLLKQKKDQGIEKFMHKLGLAYTMYFNAKNKRSGSLFQGTYKAKAVKTDGYLWQLSCYINANAEIHGIAKAEEWPWSSYLDYIGKRGGNLCDKNVILKDFRNINEYIDLTKDVVRNSKDIKNELKKYCLE